MKIKNGFFFLLEKIVKIFSVTFDYMYVPKYVQSDIISKVIFSDKFINKHMILKKYTQANIIY